MKSYLTNVLSFIELNPSEKLELEQELGSHMNDKISYYQDKGFTQEEAEIKTKLDFGEPRVFAKKINDAYFPFRYSLLKALSAVTIVFSLLVGFSIWLHQGYIPFGWVPITIVSAALLFYFIHRPSRSAKYRLRLVLLLVWLTLLYFYGWMLMDGFHHITVLYYISLALLLGLVVLSLSQILVGAVHQPVDWNLYQMKKQERITTMFVNVVSGIIVIGIGLFYIAGLLIFGFGPIEFSIMPLGIVIWLLLTIGAIKWNTHFKRFQIAKIVLSLTMLSIFIIKAIAIANL